MHLTLALVHGRFPVTPATLWSAWTFDPLVLFPLVYGAMLYVHGVRNLWRSAGRGRGIRSWQAASFGLGVLVMLVAQVSPVAAMGGALFSAHMTQHVLIMGLAAPLLVFGAPGIAFAWALPQDTLRVIRTRILHRRAFQRTVQSLTRMPVAWTLHALAIWVWHVPALYSATLSSALAHGLQHFSFFATAVLFWWVLQRRSAQGIGILYLFSTAVHSSLLGALLVFERSPLYAPYIASSGLWNLSPLEDQQLGGLIMWVPAGLVYFAGALTLLASLLRESGSRAPRWAVMLVMLLPPASCDVPDDRLRSASVAGLRPDPEAREARRLVHHYGCGACHTIPGINGADGRVGPSLEGIGSRVCIAGYLPNNSQNLQAWIVGPPRFRSPTACPFSA